MKLNADVGEQFDAAQVDSDLDIMGLIDQANIACMGHAGDGVSMATTVKLAIQNNVQIGAHPSYPDKAGFGRRSMRIPKDDLIPILHSQIGALQGVAKSLGADVTYVKPHGALYNDIIKYEQVFEDVLEAIADYHSNLYLMIQATSRNEVYREKAESKGVKLYFEAFADRAYQNNGQLVSRSEKGAVLEPEDAINQAKSIIVDNQLTCIDGSILKLDAHTICVHGDSPGALHMTQQIRTLLSH